MSESPDALGAIPLDDPVLAHADAIVEPAIDPQLDLLPTNLMTWENFERLLLRLGRDVLGLRSLSFFGKRGQAQKGLDVVGVNADGRPEGIQAKRYQHFSVADLDAAVEKYAQSTLPFDLARFIVGVGTTVHDRDVAERKIALNEAHHPLEIDIWDQSRLSEMLRDQPQIVIEFFGSAAAERFCVPHRFTPVEVASSDALATADAVLRGPLAVAGAQELLNRAENLVANDPAAALALYRDVQHRLTSAGFPGHAAEFDHTVAGLCIRAGEERAAIRVLFDSLWAAERANDSLRADRVVSTLRSVAGYGEFGPTRAQSAVTPTLGAAFEMADFVADHLHQPVPVRIDLPADAVALADAQDRARTILVAAERALGDDNLTWIASHREEIDSAAAEVAGTYDDVALRLRLTVADATGDWADLVRSARTGMRRDLKALTLARHARYQTLQGAFLYGDGDWSEAIGEACLARRHEDAADWLYSQRFVANRHQGVVEDRWHPIARALADLPSQPRLVTTASDCRQRALAALHYDRQRVAAISLRRYLLDAVRSGSVNDEIDARRLLGQVYCDTGNLTLAAYYLIHGGEADAARSAADAFGDNYQDVTALMTGPLSWVAATALQFTTEQADLIPDENVDAVVDTALGAIRDVASGARIDSPVLSPQVYLSAYGLLGALAERFSVADARAVLDMLADAVNLPEHHYRRTDGSHVKIAAGIARAFTGDLQSTALEHLVGLYARGAHPFGTAARETLMANIDQIGARMHELAEGGHHEAAALIAFSDPDQIAPKDADAAAQRLRQPTKNGPNHFSTGTGAVSDSLLATVLPAEDRAACIEMLMSNARSPYEGAQNRSSYMLAAANLTEGLDEHHGREFFDAALSFAAHPPPSQVDIFNASMRNPLGGMRVNNRSDCRPSATYLAGVLAQTPDDKRVVRDAALRLIGADADDDYRVAKTLLVVQSELGDSAPMLAQGGWPLRSLAAIIWAESIDLPAELGMALSRDTDVRVRRALATAVRVKDDQRIEAVRAVLETDPRWSVRSLLRSG